MVRDQADETSALHKDSLSTSAPVRLAFARIPIATHLLALAAVTIVTIARFLPAIDSFSEQFLGGVTGDNGLYVWLFRLHAHSAGALPWFETNGFFPYANTLAWSDNFLLPGVLGGLLIRYAGLTEAAAYNSILLSSVALSGYFVWLLIARLSGAALAGLVGAIAWLSWQYWGLQVGHPQLLMHVLLTGGVYLAFSIIRRPGFLRGLAAGLLLAASFATTVHYAVFLLLTWALIIAAILIVRPGLLICSKHISLGIGFTVGSIFSLPFIFPYLQTVAVFGARKLYEAHYFSATTFSWFAAPLGSRLYGATAELGSGEALLFPGIAIMCCGLLSIFSLCKTPALSRAVWIFLIAALSVFGMSAQIEQAKDPQLARILTAGAAWTSVILLCILGRSIGNSEARRGIKTVTSRTTLFIFIVIAWGGLLFSFGPLGNPEKDKITLGPWALVHSVFPGASSIRAVSRLGILAMLGLCIAVGISLGYAQARNSFVVFLTPFLALLIWIEGAMVIQPAAALSHRPALILELEQRARVHNKATPVLFLPYAGAASSSGGPDSWTDFASLQTKYLNWITPASSLVAVNGYSGQQTKFMREMPRQLRGFPDARSINALCGIISLSYLYVDRSVIVKPVSDPALKSIAQDSEGELFELSCQAQAFAERQLVIPTSPTAASFTVAVPKNQKLLLKPELPQQRTSDDTVTVVVPGDVMRRPVWIQAQTAKIAREEKSAAKNATVILSFLD